VDPSIADVPKTAVNWSEADRVSAARPLPDGRSLLVEPYYVNVKDDPLEGRRERVAITDLHDGNVVLEQDCYRPGTATVTEGRIAFDCEREQAGDHLLHSVVAFDAAGRKITEVKHCRNPKWMGASILTCESESVGANGKLVLAPNRVPL
jgi:hypothetical protein